MIKDGLDRLREQGCTRILAVPGMLFAAGHAKNDIPSVLNTYQAQHEGLTITYGREPRRRHQDDPRRRDRIREALERPAATCRCTRRC